MPSFAMLGFAMLGYAMLCYAMLSFAMTGVATSFPKQMPLGEMEGFWRSVYMLSGG